MVNRTEHMCALKQPPPLIPSSASSSINLMDKLEEEGGGETPDYNSRISMNCTEDANISFLSGSCCREMRCVNAREMPLSLHFPHRAHFIASMDGEEMSEPPVSVDTVRQACVLIDAEAAGLESLSLV